MYESFSMIASLVIRLKTTDDKNKSKIGIAWKRFQSANVLTEDWGFGDD